MTDRPQKTRLLKREAVLVVGVLFTVISSLLTLSYLGLEALSGVRAYVGAEERWTRAQKRAVLYLSQYVMLHEAEDYARYRDALAIPQAGLRAREALTAPKLDAAGAADALLAGGADPADIVAMVNVFGIVRETETLQRGIHLWEAADGLILQLDELARAIDAEIGSGRPDPARLKGFIQRLGQLDSQFTAIEGEFAYTLAQLARWAKVRLLQIILLMSVLLGAGGATFVVLTVRRMARSRSAQQESEERYQVLFEHSPDPVVVHADGRILDLNRAAVRLLGASAAADLVGASLLALVHPDDRARADGRGDDGSRYASREVRLLRPGGQVMEVEFISIPIMYLGRAALLVAMRDIGVWRQAERVLTEGKERAEEMVRLKSAFLANMSHEIRTPLTAIIGFADILSEEDSDFNRDFAQLIGRSGRRLLETLNSVLDLAQLEGGALALHRRPLHLPEVAAENMRLLCGLAQERGLAFRLVSPRDADIWAVLDRAALDRILTNLTSNAIKFTREGGVTLYVTRDETHAEIRVEDTGIGIDPAFLPSLFEAFQQESVGEAREFEGNGLGLAITKRLVELMGGTIHVRSQKGRGSTFTVRFPLMVQAVAARVQPFLA